MAVLKEEPFPEDILRLGIEGIREIWHKAKLRGRGYSRAAEIVKSQHWEAEDPNESLKMVGK